MLLCQSCGMNINDDANKGTNPDGTLSFEYCCYCFQKGAFTSDLSLDEQVAMGLIYSPEYKKAQTKEEKEIIRQQAKDYLSNLKRWKS